MNVTLRRLYFTPENPGAAEGYLEAMAARGWFYRSRVGDITLFSRGVPAPARYRVETTAESTIEEEQKALYAEGGWDYVDAIAPHQHLFRAMDPAVPELYTDRETEAAGYQKLYRLMRGNAVISLVLSAITALVLIWPIAAGKFWLGLVTGESLYPLLLGILFPAAVCMSVYSLTRCRRLIRLAQDGRTDGPRARWAHARRRGQAKMLLWLLFVACYVWLLLGSSSMTSTSTAQLEARGMPVVRLAEIEGQEIPLSHEEFSCFATPFCRWQAMQLESADLEEAAYTLRVDSFSLRALLPADTIRMEMLANEPFLKHALPVEDPRFDALYRDLIGGSVLSLVAQRGQTIWRVTYIGGQAERAQDLLLDAFARADVQE